MSKITIVTYKCIIMSNDNDKSVLSETHKVVAFGWSWWEDGMKLVLEMHNRSEGRWNMVVFAEQISTWAVKWRGIVFCECLFYYVGLHHRELQMAIVGFTYNNILAAGTGTNSVAGTPM